MNINLETIADLISDVSDLINKIVLIEEFTDEQKQLLIKPLTDELNSIGQILNV